MRTQSRAGFSVAVCLLLLTPLTGCSDDRAPVQRSQGRLPNPAGPGASGEEPKMHDCRVTIVLSGAVRMRVTGTGRSIFDNATGPKAFYQFTHGDTSVQVYSAGENFTASVVISTRSGSFTSEPGTEGLHVSTTGRSARVDSDTVGLDESSEGVHVKATYLCA